MKLNGFLIALFLSLPLSGEAFGQVCSISHYPYGWGMMNLPTMHGSKFEAISFDLPFVVDKGRKIRYSQFWVKADILNVRSGPSLDHNINSETYYGNLVFIYAKRGEWVSISSGDTWRNIKPQPKWVNIKYLFANCIDKQVDVQILKSKCSFKTYGILDEKNYYRTGGAFNPCTSVLSYLSHQRLLGREHSYWREYEVWRKSQDLPEKYKPPICWD